MSGSYSSRLRAGPVGGGGGLRATTVLAAKVAFASAALAAAASLARVALPQLVSGADTLLLKLYLFVAVHVIIFIIWKLSDNKHFHAAAHKDPWAPVPHHPAPPLLTEEVVLSAMKRKSDLAPAAVFVRDEEAYRVPVLPTVSRPHLEAVAAASPVDEGTVSPASCGGESCVTTASEEDAAGSANVDTADTWRNVEPAPAPARKRKVVKPAPAPKRERAVLESAPAPAQERAVVERGVSLPPPAVIVPTDEHFDGADHDNDAGGDDDLDATWSAIMQKTRPATAPALTSSSPRAPRSSPPRPAPPPRPRAREPSVGAAELSKRSEDFIKKIHHSFGRHQ